MYINDVAYGDGACCARVDYLYNCKSKISNVCNVVEGHCLQAMKILHYHANGHFDWLISGHQSVSPLPLAVLIV